MFSYVSLVVTCGRSELAGNHETRSPGPLGLGEFTVTTKSKVV